MKRIGEILRDRGLISAEALEEGLRIQRLEGGLLGEILVARLAAVAPEALAEALAAQKAAGSVTDFTRGSVLGHILRLAIFTGIYQLLEVVYVLVDLYFVGRMGEQAIAAVTMAGNLQLVSMGLGLTVMVGATPLIARAVGARQGPDLRVLFNQTMLLGFSLAAVFLVTSLAVRPVYFGWLGAEAGTDALGQDYLVWLAPGLALKLGAMALVGPMRAFGDMKVPVIANGGALLLNTALDPLLMFGWGPVPAMGVTGAGIATFIAGGAAFALMVWRFDHERRHLHFAPREWRVQPAVWGRILRIGLPVGANAAVDMSWMFLVYWAIQDFGTSAQAAVGIGEKIRVGALLPVYAIAFSIAPVVGQNLGSGAIERLRRAFISPTLVTVLGMLALALVMQVVPGWFVAPFTTDPDTTRYAVVFLTMLSWTLVAAAVLNNCLGVFEGLGNTIPPLVTDFIRLGVFGLVLAALAQAPWFEFRHACYAMLLAYLVQLLILPALLWRELGQRRPGPGEVPVG